MRWQIFQQRIFLALGMLRSLSFSASKAALLLQCPRPFVIAPSANPAPLTPAQQERANNFREAGEYGTRFHAEMARYLLGPRGLAGLHWLPDDEPFRTHLRDAICALEGWMRRDPDWAPLSVLEAEIPYASRFSGDVLYSRITKFNQETHEYDLAPGEFGGTADLLLRARDGQLVVLDLKTGRSGAWDEPAQVAQLRLLALQLGAVGVAALHTPREGVPCIYSEYIDSQRGFAEVIRIRLEQVKDGVDTPIPGSQCPRCQLAKECEGARIWRKERAVAAADKAEIRKVYLPRAE